MFASVIIATYNRCELLKKTLESLLAQQPKGQHFEVLVIDNNSKDKTKEVVESYVEKFRQQSINLRYIFEPRQGKSHALNHAIAEAKGEILAFTDDDVVISDGWLNAIQECFKKYSCDVVGGRVLPLYPENTPQWIKDNCKLLGGPIVMYDYGEGVRRYQKPDYEFIGANYAFKKEVFKEYGMFRTDIGPAQGITGEDCEIISRLNQLNKALYYCGPALVWHPVDLKRTNLKYISKWNVQLGRYRFLVDQKGQLDKKLVYIFGIPRYLLGAMVKGSLSLLTKWNNRSEFLKEWITLSNHWGHAIEARRAYQKEKMV
jgi:glycosyltransferase involved in cell wall biosynthesis